MLRDYGPVPLDNADAKLYYTRDGAGRMVIVFLDLAAKRYALYHEFRAGPSPWSTGAFAGDPTSGYLEVRDGVAQLVCALWRERQPDGRAHFGIIELERLD